MLKSLKYVISAAACASLLAACDQRSGSSPSTSSSSEVGVNMKMNTKNLAKGSTAFFGLKPADESADKSKPAKRALIARIKLVDPSDESKIVTLETDKILALSQRVKMSGENESKSVKIEIEAKCAEARTNDICDLAVALISYKETAKPDAEPHQEVFYFQRVGAAEETQEALDSKELVGKFGYDKTSTTKSNEFRLTLSSALQAIPKLRVGPEGDIRGAILNPIRTDAKVSYDVERQDFIMP